LKKVTHAWDRLGMVFSGLRGGWGGVGWGMVLSASRDDGEDLASLKAG
jgi:hypothetical protein